MINKRTRAGRSPVAGWLLMTLMSLSFLLPPPAQAWQRMTPEELLARHLEAVGPAETRASITSRIIGGTVLATFRSPGTGQFSGRLVLASEGPRVVLGVTFENSDYSREQLAFDGSSVTTSYLRPGQRSNLGDFIVTHDIILKQGLLGGALSSAWPLYNLADRNARLQLSGTERINNREAYKVRYSPRRGSDLRVTLFFDRETFQHVRTEYERVIPAGMGQSVDASASMRESRYKMIEEFSDFHREGGLTLPRSYKLSLQMMTNAGTYSADWTFALTEFAFNQRLEPHIFNLQTGN